MHNPLRYILSMAGEFTADGWGLLSSELSYL